MIYCTTVFLDIIQCLTYISNTCHFGINHLNAELNPIYHLPGLLGAHHVLHVSRIRVNIGSCYMDGCYCYSKVGHFIQCALIFVIFFFICFGCPFYFGIKVFNHLPTSIKNTSHDINKFRSVSKSLYSKNYIFI